ncbi:MAG: hypothetical protein AB8H79_03865 [Myxococcota bacterium]
MNRAICVRCGASRQSFRGICPGCGHRPVEEGLLVAWLLSTEHVESEALDAVAARIEAGDAIKPSAQQLKKAKRALGRTFQSDPGLSITHRTILLFTSLILTPLPAWFCFAWWLSSRPRAAWQSLAVAIPGSVLYFALGVYLSFSELVSRWVELMLQA